MKKQIVTITINGEDWEDSVYRTFELESSVNIITWEHDFINNRYIIKYAEFVMSVSKPPIP